MSGEVGAATQTCCSNMRQGNFPFTKQRLPSETVDAFPAYIEAKTYIFWDAGVEVASSQI